MSSSLAKALTAQLEPIVELSEFAFDIKLQCAIRVRAKSREEAERLLDEKIDAVDVNMGLWDDGTPICAEVSKDDTSPHLFEIDGVEVD